MERDRRKSIFQRRQAVPFLAILAAFVWGAAYPFIKLGLAEFGIDGMDPGGKSLFAGIRFTVAGLVVLAAAGAGRRSFLVKGRDQVWLLLYALVNTALHYFCFYIGVSNSAGSRASVLNSSGTFLLVLLSCLVFRTEHLTGQRVLGCIVGFAGLLCLNLGGSFSGAFTWLGDGMILMNALCSAFGGILTRVVGQKMDALVMTGSGLLLGGLMLILIGFCMGGRIASVSGLGILELLVLIGISVVGFSLYNQLMQYHPVGKVAIYNSLIPVFGVVLSCLLLGERFLWKYVLAAGLVAAGVWIINREKEQAE